MPQHCEGQFSWSCAHAVTSGNRVVCVGDPCQRLYSFRYAMDDVPHALEEVCEMVGCGYEEFPLTYSFRFGPKIAEEANWLLYVKKHSAQHVGGTARELIGYNTSSTDVVGGTVDWDIDPRPVTRIARTNIRLVSAPPIIVILLGCTFSAGWCCQCWF
jgi:hypothetical protein